MANSTVLSLFQNTLQGMGVATYGNPATVIGNTNQDVVQVLALTNMACDDLGREYDWQAMTLEYRFSTVYYQYTATLTTASTTISALSSTTGLTTTPTYFSVSGTGIPQDTYLVSVNAGNSTAVLSQTPTTAGTAVTITFAQTMYALPSDYDRKVDGSDWDKTMHWQMLGPKTSQEWQWLKSGYIASGPRVRYRLLGGLYQIYPALSSTEYLGLEYVSKNWCLVASAVAPSKKAFSVDTDTTVFPDSVMAALIRWKYFQVKGFDTSELREEFNRQRDIAKASDKGAQTLSFAPKAAGTLITQDNIPDTGFGNA